jgi:hypothetical protein
LIGILGGVVNSREAAAMVVEGEDQNLLERLVRVVREINMVV